jgi:hypothetical protein
MIPRPIRVRMETRAPPVFGKKTQMHSSIVVIFIPARRSLTDAAGVCFSPAKLPAEAAPPANPFTHEH